MEIQKIRSNENLKLNSFVIIDKNIHLNTVRDEFQDIHTASSFTQLNAFRKQFDTTVRWSITLGSLKAMMKNDRISGLTTFYF